MGSLDLLISIYMLSLDLIDANIHVKFGFNRCHYIHVKFGFNRCQNTCLSLDLIIDVKKHVQVWIHGWQVICSSLD
jgi:hypothetical protein